MVPAIVFGTFKLVIAGAVVFTVKLLLEPVPLTVETLTPVPVAPAGTVVVICVGETTVNVAV
jgi:hypothetical protein